jgi:hypothetical protein
MIHVSRNEYETTLRAAFAAAGLARGEALDATRASLWLELAGGQVHQRIPEILERLKLEGSLRPVDLLDDIGVAGLDARGASVLALGASIVDVAVAERRLNAIASFRVDNLADIDLSPGLRCFLEARREEARISAEQGRGKLGTLWLLFATPNCSAPPTQVNKIGGFDVGPDAWAKIVAMASRMYVPESDVSRLEGAGIGADED